MEIRYKLYPYPVLAYYSDDYKKASCFDAAVDIRKKGYNICIDFTASLKNDGLKALIQSGQAQYTYHIECAQTGMRRAYTTRNSADSCVIKGKEVCGKLQICPFVTAVSDIDGYTNDEFDDDYAGSTFDVEEGCVLAVGKQVTAEISKELDDLSNTPSIFSIIRNMEKKDTQMRVNIDSSKIIIKLPIDDWHIYKNLQSESAIQPVLNSMTVLPALTYALAEIKNMDAETRSESLGANAWYRTLRKTLLNRFECNIEGSSFEQENPLELAQKLINDPVSDAFRVLSEGFRSEGSDDE